MRRLLLLGTIVCAVVAAGQRPHLAGPAPAAAQAGERVEFREAPPSCAQAIKDLHLEGQPVDCEEPPLPTYDPPQMHGPYRLIAPTYVGPLTYRDDPAPAFPVGAVSEDREVLQRSPLYRPPAWLPKGYHPGDLEDRRHGLRGRAQRPVHYWLWPAGVNRMDPALHVAPRRHPARPGFRSGV